MLSFDDIMQIGDAAMIESMMNIIASENHLFPL